jgi:hypothetical protein
MKVIGLVAASILFLSFQSMAEVDNSPGWINRIPGTCSAQAKKGPNQNEMAQVAQTSQHVQGTAECDQVGKKLFKTICGKKAKGKKFSGVAVWEWQLKFDQCRKSCNPAGNNCYDVCSTQQSVINMGIPVVHQCFD